MFTSLLVTKALFAVLPFSPHASAVLLANDVADAVFNIGPIFLGLIVGLLGVLFVSWFYLRYVPNDYAAIVEKLWSPTARWRRDALSR